MSRKRSENNQQGERSWGEKNQSPEGREEYMQTKNQRPDATDLSYSKTESIDHAITARMAIG
jgi:hypothetical protein